MDIADFLGRYRVQTVILRDYRSFEHVAKEASSSEDLGVVDISRAEIICPRGRYRVKEFTLLEDDAGVSFELMGIESEPESLTGYLMKGGPYQSHRRAFGMRGDGWFLDYVLERLEA